MASEKKMRKISRKLHWGRSSCFLKTHGKGIKGVSFYTPSDRMNDKDGPSREFDDNMAYDVNCELLLSKYGPEDLWVIADKLKEVAMKDVQDGIDYNFLLDEAYYYNVLKKIKEDEEK